MAAPLNLSNVEGEALFVDLWRSEDNVYITTRKGYSHRNKKMVVLAGMAETFGHFLCRFARQHNYSTLNCSNEIAYISTHQSRQRHVFTRDVIPLVMTNSVGGP